jgi:anaerobic selenocysteine-containing dehydrogenase
MNEEDMAELGLEHGDRVDIETALPGHAQRLMDITVVAWIWAKAR